jgi:hypothetical protein
MCSGNILHLKNFVAGFNGNALRISDKKKQSVYNCFAFMVC